VAEAQGLRPTKDSVRETLFNWLQPVLEGARCLDAFAGSGALGFEAASRGAGEVVLLDSDPRLCAGLQEQARGLEAGNVQIARARAETYLSGGARPPGPFDIVFLDPPYGSDVLAGTCRLLAEGGWLREAGQVYLETGKQSGWPELPAGWRWLRQKTAGEVAYGLAAVAG
jgi:16S rRNA (guanine966-N2)-methyltransferase